ncbi:MAG TPA: pyruvate formate lyase-activating protein [Candidatus Merdivicinus excrementipullorum]|uniref:Pyruvate formate-lyase-activating enzyme n=1 Tax=Candidatus Merdivicinus excrementipullorum TaxID=2840867 RepID=A0A9D1FLH7_9FIRM|nr:pyruvate formate lyase-activating protein [Candidatus Merdivicinus excrementipullorum]
MTGKIHSIQSLGTVDGPGVRTVVFMQGCPLRCGYCHNPDTWDPNAGETVDTAEVFAKIKRFRPYFGPEGGVTVSGGEALLQPDFVRELFALCKNESIHTALDTSGCLWNEQVESLLDVTDLALLDIKMTTDADYREYVGCSLEKPLFFLSKLEEKGIPAWIRHVVVPGLTDAPENIRRLRDLLKGYSYIQKVEFLPFHKICVPKYEKMGIPFPFDRFPAASKDQAEQAFREYQKGS